MEIQVGSLSTIAYFLNTLVLLIGSALAGIGIHLYLLTAEIGTSVNNELAPIMIILVAIGGVLFFTATIGLCGVCNKASVMLSGFLAAMIIVLLAQFAAVVIMFTFEASVHYYLEEGLEHSILFYGKTGENAKFTESIDFLQEKLECCGHYGYKDYASPNASNWFSTNSGSLPDSCCKEITDDCGLDATNSTDNSVEAFNTKGCYDPALDFIQLWLAVAGSCALVFMFIQIISIFLNISLQKRYKEHEDYQLQSKKVKQVKEQEVAQEKMAGVQTGV